MHDIQNSGKLAIHFIKNSAMYSVLAVAFVLLFLPFFFIYYACIYTRASSPILLGWSLLLFFVVSSTVDCFLSHICRLYSGL